MTEIDLALAATAPHDRRESILRAATREGGYDLYKGFKANVSSILNVAINPLLPASPMTKSQIKRAIKRVCNDAPGEVDNNQSLGEALCDYALAHNVSGAEFVFDPVSLGRAGRRYFWQPFVLKIDGRKYIPFFDARRTPRRLTPEACRFIFSIDHNHIRLGDPAMWGDVGFVIFQFEDSRTGPRKVIPHFDHGISLWNDGQIARMIDDTYRRLDDIRRAA